MKIHLTTMAAIALAGTVWPAYADKPLDDYSFIRGVNYGMTTNQAILERDLGYAKRINLNSTRIWLNYQAYERAPEAYLNRLRNYVRTAHRLGFSTIPILWNGNNLSASFKPADFGIPGDAYVYDYFAATGTVVNAGSAFDFITTMPQNTNGGSYFITVPIGPSGIALVGDTNKFVTLGKKRIPGVSDNGQLSVAIAFAAGETNMALFGFPPSLPQAQAVAGSAGNVTYDATTHLFSLNVSPDNSGNATVGFSLATGSPPQKRR